MSDSNRVLQAVYEYEVTCDKEYMSERKGISDAEAAGLIVNRSNEHTLQFDIDSYTDLKFYEKNIVHLAKFIGPYTETRTRSKSGNYHIYVETVYRNFSQYERILLQAVLGSDRTREFLSWQNIQEGKEDPIVLFEVPEENTPDLHNDTSENVILDSIY